jgi:LPS-assembly lipoprotein
MMRMMLLINVGIKLVQLGRFEHRGRWSIAALSLAAALGGCGFELEGSGPLPSTMTRTYLDTSRPHSEFSGSLRSALRLRGSLVVDSREEADSVLLISEDDTGQRVLSVSARNTPREYEVYYAVTVAVQAGSRQLMGPESMIVTRSYTYDETQVLGKSAEERVLRRSLADDLARQVLRRIESISEQSAAPNT